MRQWNYDTLHEMLGNLDLMHNGVMPPFAGTEDEQNALTAFIASVEPTPPAAQGPEDGRVIFNHMCANCHQEKPDDSFFTRLRDLDAQTAEQALTNLPGMFIRMPNLKLNTGERETLVMWARTRFPKN
jgi:mono/diheme cytochrome c family protein